MGKGGGGKNQILTIKITSRYKLFHPHTNSKIQLKFTNFPLQK
nr:MAG TPA: hypothetical protein [Caudoviricetes sp.]